MIKPRLFHVSEQPGLAVFEPRPPRPDHPLGVSEPLVFAIEERLLHNYLLPRDCPRVTFYARPDSDPADVARLLGATAARHVVAIESGWLDRVRRAVLWLYEFPVETFKVIDAGAGYWVSRASVRPVATNRVDDALAELVRRGVEFRVTPSLWPLRDAVLASTLQFSFIRLRNSQSQE